MRRLVLFLVIALLFMTPLLASAQNIMPAVPGTPTWPWWHPWNPYHPENPANLARYGTTIRYIYVLPRTVVIPTYDAVAGVYPYTAIVPGYTVTETTTGYIYPARWELHQVGPGVYQWVLMPAFFQPKY